MKTSNPLAELTERKVWRWIAIATVAFLLARSWTPLPASAGVLDSLGEPQIVGIHTVTRHDPGNGANDINPGAYLITDKGWMLGTYYNSHFRQTFYAGWTTQEWNRFRLTVSFNTGYYAYPTGTIVPTFRLYTFDNGVNLRLAGGPKLEDKGQAIQHLMFDWNF